MSASRRPTSDETGCGRRLFGRCQALAYRSYYALAAANYDRALVARPNRTPAGTVWSYDPLNRHGTDEMLAAVERWCGPDDVVYDVGAYVGFYAVSLAAERRRVLAFEPSPPVVERLQTMVARNGVADQVEIHAYGVSDSAGERDFFVSTYPELSGFDRESATRWGARVRRRVTVPVRPLDAVVSSAPTPDVLKLDVEGDGPAVLRGARETLETARPALFIETHATQLSGTPSAEMQSLLAESDYRIEERDGYWRALPEE